MHPAWPRSRIGRPRSNWIDAHANLLICNPAGVGKNSMPRARNKACCDNRSVLNQCVPRLAELAPARGDGPHQRMLRALGRVDLLILDDGTSSRSTPPPATMFWRSSKIAAVIDSRPSRANASRGPVARARWRLHVCRCRTRSPRPRAIGSILAANLSYR
ncbi:ATP-binding protein [Bradyrhizobium sp. 168]|uniref:ATP-binding protein n=1 Tax=Bradyrhizobium sp. 168 TaxID=2782639 RepID=UPI001FFAE12B|nr:ATP-binding protein [Bradyrhizobium sp. 168]